jgi:hypothetical protein
MFPSRLVYTPHDTIAKPNFQPSIHIHPPIAAYSHNNPTSLHLAPRGLGAASRGIRTRGVPRAIDLVGMYAAGRAPATTRAGDDARIGAVCLVVDGDAATWIESVDDDRLERRTLGAVAGRRRDGGAYAACLSDGNIKGERVIAASVLTGHDEGGDQIAFSEGGGGGSAEEEACDGRDCEEVGGELHF